MRSFTLSVITAIVTLTTALVTAAPTEYPTTFPDQAPSKYSVVDNYFLQDDPSTDSDTFDVVDVQNFGLKSKYNWSDVIDQITLLNKNHESAGKKYKLLFLARHGEGIHNVVPKNYLSQAWTCYWQIRDGNGEYTWFDAELTQNGVNQANRISEAWIKNLKTGAPLPQSYYISPLSRTLQTYNYTWSPISTGKIPVIKELSRETYGIGTDSKRHPKSYIASNWPDYEFEEGFSEPDLLWTTYKHESKQHRNYRARVFLDDLFHNDDNLVISLTSHSGFIHSILKVINHRKFDLSTGQMIPVIVEAVRSEEKLKLNKPWTYYNKLCPSSQSVFQVSKT